MSDIKVNMSKGSRLQNPDCMCSRNDPPALGSNENGKAAPRDYKSPKVPNTSIEGHSRGTGNGQ